MSDNPNSIEAQDDGELLDDKLDRLNSKVQSLMQGLAALELPAEHVKYDFSSRLNGPLPIDELDFTEQGFEQAEALSDISDDPIIFEYSFIELAKQRQAEQLSRANMQVEDYRSHELRDEEQMLSFEEFVELTNQVLCAPHKDNSPQDESQDTQSTGSLGDCSALTQRRDKLEREAEELRSRICCMRLQGSEVSKFSGMLTGAQTLLSQLNYEVSKAKRTNTCLIARGQQLEIQNEKTRAYQAKLKAKMLQVKDKAKLLSIKEEELSRHTQTKSQLAQLKDKLSRVLAENQPNGQERDRDRSKGEVGLPEGERRPLRSNTVRTMESQEKVNRILEETKRQNKTFKALMPKLSVFPTEVPQHTRTNSVGPMQSQTASVDNPAEQREQDLKATEQLVRSEQLKLSRLRQELSELLL
jgi:hypothetical protein